MNAMIRAAIITTLLVGNLETAATAATPEAKCQAGKNQEAGKYAFCLEKAEKSLVGTTGACSVTSTLACNRDAECPGTQTCVKDLTRYNEAIAKCVSTFGSKWLSLEQKAVEASTTCPTTGDQAIMQSLVETHASTVAAALAGDGLPDCGDGSINVPGEQCDGADLGGASCASFGIPSGSLACSGTCEFDTSSCTVACGTCGDGIRDGLESCDGLDLGGESCTSQGFAGGTLGCTLGCAFNLSSCTPYAFPATGQTTQYAVNDDGALEAGATLSYTDNGDGTITDNSTGLMWEKKMRLDGFPAGADPHDADNCYPWAGTCSSSGDFCGVDADCPGGQTCGTTPPSGCSVGATIFQWVAGLNAANFAGYNDWRIPNIKELQSIVDYRAYSPSVAQAFQGASCGASCSNATDPACSCTYTQSYWSSTTLSFDASSAFIVDFYSGPVGTTYKLSALFVRAVRGGTP